MHFVLGDTSFVDHDVGSFWWAVDEKDESKDARKHQEAEDDVAEDDGDDSEGERDDSHSPEPLGTSFFVFVFMGTPLDPERFSSHC